MLLHLPVPNIWNQPRAVICISVDWLSGCTLSPKWTLQDHKGPCGEFFLTLGDWDDPGLEEMSPEDSTSSNSFVRIPLKQGFGPPETL